MPEAPDYDLNRIDYAMAELVNFVNNGKCDPSSISLLTPFVDRYVPVWNPVGPDDAPAQDAPEARPGRDPKWPTEWPARLRLPHRLLREALREQLERLTQVDPTKRRPLILPTRPEWTEASFKALPAIEATTLFAVQRAFDEALAFLQTKRVVFKCRECSFFLFREPRRGRPTHFCENCDTTVPARDMADYMRRRRAALKAGAVSRGDR